MNYESSLNISLKIDFPLFRTISLVLGETIIFLTAQLIWIKNACARDEELSGNISLRFSPWKSIDKKGRECKAILLMS